MRTTATVLLLVLGLLVSACTASPDPGGSAGPTPPATSAGGTTYHRYVALGDSFTAAPYVPRTALAQGCLRSSGNYPALLAERLDVRELVDVSCSGADTTDLFRPQNTFRHTTVPAQLDALTAGTDLVTLGIGGNDLDLFATLLQTCIAVRGVDPSGAPCEDRLSGQGVDLTAQVATIRDRVVTALRRIRRRAPHATVLLVGYPRLVPTRGGCPRLLPLARGDYRLARRVQRGLEQALRAAARVTGTGYVSMYGASRGHDICADDPWVNGQFTDQTAALAFHPFSAEMTAVADRVADRLTG